LFLLPANQFVCGEEEVTVDVLYSKFCMRGPNIRMLLYESFSIYATSILMYMHGCNRKFYNTYVTSHCTKKKVTCRIMAQMKDIH
jgi:hypothetical protein